MEEMYGFNSISEKRFISKEIFWDTNNRNDSVAHSHFDEYPFLLISPGVPGSHPAGIEGNDTEQG